MEMKSDFKFYQELVYSVVEHALNVRNIQTAIDTVLSIDIWTRNEILQFTELSIQAYTKDCIRLYVSELERKLESAEFQIAKFKEEGDKAQQEILTSETSLNAIGSVVNVLYLDGDFAETGRLENDNGFMFTVRHEDNYPETFEHREYKYVTK